jgi:hypothetical protein
MTPDAIHIGVAVNVCAGRRREIRRLEHKEGRAPNHPDPADSTSRP